MQTQNCLSILSKHYKKGTSESKGSHSSHLVEPRGVEPLSEDFRDKLSTGLAKNMAFPFGVPFLLEAIG